MYLVNTTYGWNLGDDLIREGVFNLLGLSGEPTVYVNRAQVRRGGSKTPLWKVLANMPPPDELCRNAKGFVVAGTPEWVNYAQEFYKACLRRGVPIYLVGVGMTEDHKLLAQCRPLIKGATVRDRFAKSALLKAGISAPWFPDPAFHADFPQPPEKKFSLVVNYRAKGGNGAFKDDHDGYWRRVAREFGRDIGIVTVHEAGEYERAAAIFDAPIFYSSNYLDYKPIYASAARYLGGRIHGAVPVVASGGTAWLVYRAKKVDAMRQVAKLGETLRVLSYREFPDSLDRRSPDSMLRELEARRVQHRAYWAECRG